MSSTAGTITRRVEAQQDFLPTIDLADTIEAPASLGDVSCWRLLSARVPLTLLLDLALPEERLRDLQEEMLAEPTSTDWIPRQR